MAIPAPKIELGLDGDSPIFPGFTLDNLDSGRLDNTHYFLAGGLIFFDISDRVRAYSFSRGRSQLFANFTAGQFNIELNNHDRAFDPQYLESPFAGNIVPRREIKIYSEGVIQFSGWVDDWNLSYSPNGNSIAEAVGSDGLAVIAGQNLTGATPVIEATGSRIDSILSDPDVQWDSRLRDIDAGLAEVGNQVIEGGTNALNYLQQVARTESGLLFVSKDGKVTFRESLRPFNIPGVIDFNDDGGIGFQNLAVNYGSELLYNDIIVARVDGGTATASDLNSQASYGIKTYQVNDLLASTDEYTVGYALNLAERFSEPDYRFESLEVALHALTPTKVDEVLNLELGSVARIQFTPNGVGDPIAQYGEIIRIDHNVGPETHFVTFSFNKLTQAVFTLNDLIFGKLDEANVLGAPENSWTLSNEIYGRLSAGMALQ